MATSTCCTMYNNDTTMLIVRLFFVFLHHYASTEIESYVHALDLQQAPLVSGRATHINATLKTTLVLWLHGVWLTRVGELRGFADASHCRVIAENGAGVISICQHHFHTGCTSPTIVNVVTTRMFNIGNSDSAHRSYFVSSRSPSPFVFHRSHFSPC